MSGALHSVGRKGEPPTIPLNLVGDFAGGGMLLAFGILCALIEAMRSGQGQVVDAAMVDGAASLMTFMHGLRAQGVWSDVRGENSLDGASPWYQVYETSDGQHVSVANVEKKFHDELLRLTGLDKGAIRPPSTTGRIGRSCVRASPSSSGARRAPNGVPFWKAAKHALRPC